MPRVTVRSSVARPNGFPPSSPSCSANATQFDRSVIDFANVRSMSRIVSSAAVRPSVILDTRVYSAESNLGSSLIAHGVDIRRSNL
jgi:hypothetical protein